MTIRSPGDSDMSNGAGNKTGTRLPRKPPAFKKTLIAAGIVMLCVIIFQTWKIVGSGQTVALTSGELKKVYTTDGILFRDETVVVSPANGQLNLLLPEGERVRAGENVAEIKTLSGDAISSERSALIRAPRSGILIVNIDGLEGAWIPGQSDILEIANTKLEDNDETESQSQNKKSEKGRPVLKVVDNLSPVVVCLQVPPELSPSLFKKDASVKMVWENNKFNGLVEEIRNYQGKLWLVLRVANYPPAFLQKRKVTLGLDGGSVSGYLVSTKSLVEKDGRTGLYIMNKYQVKWVPVKVKGIESNQAAVIGDGFRIWCPIFGQPQSVLTKI